MGMIITQAKKYSTFQREFVKYSNVREIYKIYCIAGRVFAKLITITAKCRFLSSISAAPLKILINLTNMLTLRTLKI